MSTRDFLANKTMQPTNVTATTESLEVEHSPTETKREKNRRRFEEADFLADRQTDD